MPEGMGYFPEGTALTTKKWLQWLYNDQIDINNRIRAYKALSDADPLQFPPISEKFNLTDLIHSISAGKISKATKALKPPTPRAFGGIDAGLRGVQEQALFDPEAPLDSRVDAYYRLSQAAPQQYPQIDTVALQADISSGSISKISGRLHPEFRTPREIETREEKARKETVRISEREESKAEARAIRTERAKISQETLGRQLKEKGYGFEDALFEIKHKKKTLESARDAAGAKLKIFEPGKARESMTEFKRETAAIDERIAYFDERQEMIERRFEELRKPAIEQEEPTDEVFYSQLTPEGKLLGLGGERSKFPDLEQRKREIDIQAGIGQPEPQQIQQSIIEEPTSQPNIFDALPEGATQIGTYRGVPVYQTSDGKKFMEQQ